jgi:hypothetical protein
LVGAHRPGHGQRRLLRQCGSGLEDLLAHVALEDHALGDACAIPQLDELELALVGLVVDPAAQRYFLAFVAGDVLNLDDLRHGSSPHRLVAWELGSRDCSTRRGWVKVLGGVGMAATSQGDRLQSTDYADYTDFRCL